MSVLSFAYSRGYYNEVIVKNSKDIPDIGAYNNKSRNKWFEIGEIVEFSKNYGSYKNYAYYKNKTGKEMILEISDLTPVKTNRR